MRMLHGMLVAVFLAGAASAVEIKGPVTKVDAENATITLTVDGKDQTFAVAKDAKITSTGKAKKGQPATGTTIALKDIKPGSEATLDAEKKDDRTIINAIKIEPAKKKKKKNQ